MGINNVLEKHLDALFDYRLESRRLTTPERSDFYLQNRNYDLFANNQDTWSQLVSLDMYEE